MSKATFDGPNKLIIINSGITELDVSADLYSDWKEWASEGSNLKFLGAMRVVGGDPLVGSQVLGSTFFLTNGWRIRPQEANHRLLIKGNLYTEEGDTPVIPTLGSYNVVVDLNTSNIVDKFTNEQIASMVWDESSSNHTIVGTKGREVKELKQLLYAVISRL